MGSDVNVFDKEGKFFLYYCRLVEVVKMMVDVSVDVNFFSILGKIFLYYVCILNVFFGVVKIFL